MVASGSRTVIAGSLSSCIAGFQQSCRFSQSSGLRRSCGWHRAGFRRYWRWKSNTRRGRPQIQTELRVLIRQMSMENPLWGAPRIHGELLRLGFQVAQSSVAKYMAKPRGVWVARQITEAFPWNEAPRYMIRDRDCIYGAVVTRRLRAMGIRDKPIAPAPPWQNGFAERLIGSIRRECLDHIIVLGEAHLRRILKSYARYYNETRTHLALDKDAPLSRTVKRAGRILCRPILGGLHHEYVRI